MVKPPERPVEKTIQTVTNLRNLLVIKPGFLGKVSFFRWGMIYIKTRKMSMIASEPN